jgi:pectate lyase
MAAFPGVEGYGANATGGRGGIVLTVTNGNDSGAGSLRWALEQNSGPRTVVFAVNEVKLTRDVEIRSGDVTIAGQTAGGVEVSGAGVIIRSSNVIMRGMMIRPGDGRTGPDPDVRDALQINASDGPVRNIVIDHNSFSWGLDDTVQFYRAVSNVTFSNNIVAQGLRDSLHSEGPHSMGLLVFASKPGEQADRLTISDNLFAFNEARNPWIKNGTNVEVVNNLIIGSGDQAQVAALGDNDARFASSPFSARFMNNYYEAGAEARRSEMHYVGIRSSAAGDAYFAGNLSYDESDRPLAIEHSGQAAKAPLFSGSGIKLGNAKDVPASVLANAGANPAFREGVDKRVIDAVKAERGGVVDSVAEAGGYGGRRRFVAPLDSDRDGIPDTVEQRMGTNSRLADSSRDRNGDGFTNLEEYVNSLLSGGSLPTAPSSPTLIAPPSTSGSSTSGASAAGATNTGLDAIVGLIRSDGALASEVSRAEIDAGATAAAGLNKMIVDGIRATGVANDGSISVNDVYALNSWFRADGARSAAFLKFFGSTSGAESGYQLVAFEGSESRTLGLHAMDTVFGSIYRIGFAIDDGGFGGPSGLRPASVWQVRDYLSKLLAADLTTGELKSGAVTAQTATARTATLQTASVAESGTSGAKATGTGLDRIVDVIENDWALARNLSEADIQTGAAAARNLNALIHRGVEALDLMDGGRITMSEVGELNRWIRADSARLDSFLFNHGKASSDSGYEAVDHEGAAARMFGFNAVDTVFGAIYDVGFAASSTHLRDAYTGRTTYMDSVASWMTTLLNDDGLA